MSENKLLNLIVDDSEQERSSMNRIIASTDNACLLIWVDKSDQLKRVKYQWVCMSDIEVVGYLEQVKIDVIIDHRSG